MFEKKEDGDNLIYILKDNNKTIFKIWLDKQDRNIKKLQLFKYNEKDALNLILSKTLTNDNPSSIIPFDEDEIGINILQIYLALGLLSLNNNNANIILKFFDFYPKNKFKNYFELMMPDFDNFLKDLNNDKIINKLIIIPLTIEEHLSLLLVYNNNIYILDFALSHFTDEFTDKAKKLISDLKGYIKKNNYNIKLICNIFDSCLSNNLDPKNELIKNDIYDNILNEKIEEILALEKKTYWHLDENTIKLDAYYFHNNDLCKKVKILNIFPIQGLKGCGYYCLASYKLIIDNKYNIEDIVSLCKTGLFQIQVVIIILNDLLKDKQNIIIIDSKLTNEYEKYIKNDIIVGIKKAYKDIEIAYRKKKNLKDINLNKILDIKSFANMLKELGFNKL